MGWVNASRGRSYVFLKINAKAALAFVVLLLGVVACDPATGAPDLPDIELPTIARPVAPESVPATAAPVATVNPEPSPTPTLAPNPTVGVDVVSVPMLEIAEIPAELPAYSRDDWKHWNDVDKDCQDTRAEVLIEESMVPPTFKNKERCRVISGLWEGPYTGQSFMEASDVDIDHLVPLKNAHLSGGWQWDEERKEDYANSMATDYHLIAVDKSANRSKGAKGPEEWQPSNAAYHCQYSRDWIAVKAAWELTATAAEWRALEEMLATCSDAVVAGDDGGPKAPDPQATPAPPVDTPSPSPTPVAEPFTASLVITEIMPDPSVVRDAAGEWFEIHNPDWERAVELKGWTIRKDEDDGHRISEELPVLPGGYVILARNGDKATNGEIAADYEYQGLTLTNDGDVIELVAPTGRVVDRVEYGGALVFPGASTSLDPGSLDAGANDDAANWCRATSAMPNGDFGTPGQVNDGCR